MNEYVCDYTEEIIDNKAYYKLPNIGIKELQRYLIRGIDTSDRELLPFRQYGINCIQPYAVLCDIYLGLDEKILQIDDVKSKLNSFLVPPEILGLIPKKKLRAQIGTHSTMGILGLCHKQKLTDQDYKKGLLNRTCGTAQQIPIFVGKYDVEDFVELS